MNVLLEIPLGFPLKEHGYTLDKVLNNENRWNTKIVCRILGNDFRRYVSTTYAKQGDYLELLETITYLCCNGKLSPKIARLYPKDKTIVCEYIGEFLTDYILKNSTDLSLSITSVLEYLKDINSINKAHKTFVIPPVIRTSLQLAKALGNGFEFLPETETVLPRLENSYLKFCYGYGIEDPHIWNFRIVNDIDKIQALTTDFDYFSSRVNCFWELGYFYATFRWFRKTSLSIGYKAENILLSLIQNLDLRSEFMFWLGVLSSYCGYRDSLMNLMPNDGIDKLKQQRQLIRQLDRKVSYLANRLLQEDLEARPTLPKTEPIL